MIQWGNFVVVAVVAVVATVALTLSYSGGVRLVSDGRAAEDRVRMAAGYACYALCAVAVLFGLWLVIPQFH